MNTQYLKSSVSAAVLTFTALFSHAQKIQEKDLIKNVSPITGSAEMLSKLHPVSFVYNTQTYKHLQLPAGLQYGFLPSDAASAFPGIVKENSKFISAGKNAYKTAVIETVDMTSLIPFLISSLKEQHAEIEKLKAELQLLKKK